MQDEFEDKRGVTYQLDFSEESVDTGSFYEVRVFVPEPARFLTTRVPGSVLGEYAQWRLACREIILSITKLEA